MRQCKKMIAKEIAHMLDGTEYGESMPAGVLTYAKENGVVIVFGASDDLIEFKGAIEDEEGCFEGGTVYITRAGILRNECDNPYCPYFPKKASETKAHITALWCAEKDYLWTYDSNIPHETFEMTEDGGEYCRGIVFDLEDVPE